MAKLLEIRWEKQYDWAEERREFGDGTPYTICVHNAWCKEENFGVLYMGAMTTDHRIIQIQLNVFHGRSTMVKFITNHVRHMLEGVLDKVT